jgi:hypothetical protein
MFPKLCLSGETKCIEFPTQSPKPRRFPPLCRVATNPAQEIVIQVMVHLMVSRKAMKTVKAIRVADESVAATVDHRAEIHA